MSKRKEVILLDDGDNGFFEQLEKETLIEMFGKEDGERFFNEDEDVDFTEDMPTDEELDAELDELLDDECKAFDDEPELTDEEVKAKYGIG